MTREEQIKKQSGIYTDDASNYTEWSDGWEDSNDIKLIEKAFIKGAEWADEHPNKKLVYTKQELLDMGFSFDLNGNISTPQEIEERSKKYINYRKNKWIDKACKLLAKMVLEVTYEDFEVNSVEHYDKMEFIEDFKKYMEE